MLCGEPSREGACLADIRNYKIAARYATALPRFTLRTARPTVEALIFVRLLSTF
jgi:hypothetical protein